MHAMQTNHYNGPVTRGNGLVKVFLATVAANLPLQPSPRIHWWEVGGHTRHKILHQKYNQFAQISCYNLVNKLLKIQRTFSRFSE